MLLPALIDVMLPRPCSTLGATAGSEYAAANAARRPMANLRCYACNRFSTVRRTARLHSPSSGAPSARRPGQRAVCSSAPAQTGKPCSVLDTETAPCPGFAS